MKAEELMIGDWVMVNRSECVADGGQYFKWQEVGRIMRLEDGIITVRYRDHEETDTIDWAEEFEKDVKPIPITPEILEKNGFGGATYLYLEIDECNALQYYPYEHRLCKIFEGIDEWNNHAKIKEVTFQCQCFYLHELQHALRLCGIEKEIEQ